MTTAIDKQKLRDAFQAYVHRLANITEAVLDGRGYDYADRIALQAIRCPATSARFWELLSIHHVENMGLDTDEEAFDGFRTIRPNSPCENPDDFAEWVKQYASCELRNPFPSAHAIPITVDGRPALHIHAAE